MTSAGTRSSRRVVVVTGANSGIGLAVAQALVRHGVHVVLAVRNTDECERATAGLDGPGSRSVVQVGLADLNSVAVFARSLLTSQDDLSPLVCNVRWRRTTWATPR